MQSLFINMDQPEQKYEVGFDDAALRDLKKMTPQAQVQILNKAEELSKDPRPANVEKLVGYDNLYRVRSGNYRIVYTIEDDQLYILVVAIGDRKAIYEIIKRRLS